MVPWCYFVHDKRSSILFKCKCGTVEWRPACPWLSNNELLWQALSFIPQFSDSPNWKVKYATHSLTDDGVFCAIDPSSVDSTSEGNVETEIQQHMPAFPANADGAVRRETFVMQIDLYLCQNQRNTMGVLMLNLQVVDNIVLSSRNRWSGSLSSIWKGKLLAINNSCHKDEMYNEKPSCNPVSIPLHSLWLMVRHKAIWGF